MKKIWVNKTGSFKESGRFDEDYYLSMSGTERLETTQFLREIFIKIRNENRKGLRRIIKVVQ